MLSDIADDFASLDNLINKHPDAAYWVRALQETGLVFPEVLAELAQRVPDIPDVIFASKVERYYEGLVEVLSETSFRFKERTHLKFSAYLGFESQKRLMEMNGWPFWSKIISLDEAVKMVTRRGNPGDMEKLFIMTSDPRDVLSVCTTDKQFDAVQHYLKGDPKDYVDLQPMRYRRAHLESDLGL